jgi:arylsulfatase A-like enzyme
LLNFTAEMATDIVGALSSQIAIVPTLLTLAGMSERQRGEAAGRDTSRRSNATARRRSTSCTPTTTSSSSTCTPIRSSR